MKPCNFDYLYQEPDIKNIENFIKELINKYQEKYDELKKMNVKNLEIYSKNDFVQLTKDHKTIMLNLIKDIIKFFPQLSNIPYIVFIHGSFAKTLNRLQSDIDLNILYPNKYKRQLLPVEELIAIILQTIIGYSGRDKIHPMMIYTYNNFKKKLIESTQECTITFPDNNKYYYHCRPNFDEVMHKIKHSSREYKDFSKYIKFNIASNKCEEWCYSFETIYSNCYNIDELLTTTDKNLVSNTTIKDFNNLITNLVYLTNNSNFDLLKNNSISDINKNLKVRNLGFIYQTLALVRRYLYINNKPVKSLDYFVIFKDPIFTSLFSAEDIEEIENSIFMYIWQLSRIENVFYNNNINFSSRNYDYFSFEKLKNLYKDLYEDDLNEMQDYVTKKLYNSLEKVLTKIFIGGNYE